MSDFTFIDLLSIKGMTEARLAHLIKKFKEPDVIFNLSYNELVYEQEIEHELAERLVDYRRDNRTRDAISKCQDLGVKVVTFLDDEYPDGLKNITQAPPVLFIRGTYQECDACAIALIGTRRATTYGRTVTDKFAREFCAAGVTVISGLARGIDTQAHMSALAEGGRTIAVMGTGIDRIYPPENQRLAERIVKSGALFTEFNFGTQPLAMNFPKRNRIIAGLSMAVVAVEAQESSGVMNTVNWALNQGKEVFAVPGSIFSKYSSGTNNLIKAGASIATSAQVVLEELNLVKRKKTTPLLELNLTEDESMVISLLSETPVYLDEIAQRLNRPVPAILNILLAMELKGLIRQLPGMTFVRKF